MDIAYIGKKYIKNDEFNRYWIPYKWCALRHKEFSCGCGATLKPKVYTSTDEIAGRDIALLCARLYNHIHTPKHRNSIGKQIEYNDHLVKRFKKEVFYDEHDNWEKEAYAEFEDYEKKHKEYIEEQLNSVKYKKWLEKQAKKGTEVAIQV